MNFGVEAEPAPHVVDMVRLAMTAPRTRRGERKAVHHMLWNASAILGYQVHGSDHDLGTVHDMLFDHRDWTLRWLVVDLGPWLPGRKVLLPKAVLQQPNPALKRMSVSLSAEQIRVSPDVDLDLPVSQDNVHRLYDFYALDLLGNLRTSDLPPQGSSGEGVRPTLALNYAPHDPDPSLHSLNAMLGYHLVASDGGLGYVSDALIDVDTWAIRGLSVTTGAWWPSAKVLLPTAVIQKIDWEASEIHLGIDQALVRASPPYEPKATVDGAYLASVLTYYGVTWITP